jgi:predicted DNA-binding ribbon-helix-helix protein
MPPTPAGLADRRTSLRLDDLTWDALRDIAARECVTIHEVAQWVYDGKPRGLSLTVALRCYVVGYLLGAARAGRTLN